MVLKLHLESRHAAFVYPIEPKVRTAVLVPLFRSSDVAPVFAEGWGPAAAAFDPAAIAATKAQLALIAASGKVPSLTHGIVRVARSGERWLTDVERDSLWNAFRVPVYEQVVDRLGTVLAQECEAHDGLHIESMVFSDELTARGYYIENEACGCGRPSLRLKPSKREDRFGRAAYRQLLRLSGAVEEQDRPSYMPSPQVEAEHKLWQRRSGNDVLPKLFLVS